MLARNSHHRLGLLLGEPSFTAALMERGRRTQRMRQTERARLRPIEVVATPPQGLLGIPQQPQEPGEIGATHNARVMTIEHGRRALALRHMETKPGLHVGTSLDALPTPK
jgi:hypothetical protein